MDFKTDYSLSEVSENRPVSKSYNSVRRWKRNAFLSQFINNKLLFETADGYLDFMPHYQLT